MTGRFVVLEGGDGSGKSTQVPRLADWLRERGLEVVGHPRARWHASSASCSARSCSTATTRSTRAPRRC